MAQGEPVPELPKGWDDPQSPLHFRMPRDERAFLKLKLGQLARSNDEAPCLLARLVVAEDLFEDASLGLPKKLDARADAADKLALGVARAAAALAAIGRAAMGHSSSNCWRRIGGEALCYSLTERRALSMLAQSVSGKPVCKCLVARKAQQLRSFALVSVCLVHGTDKVITCKFLQQIL
jgi:hypothetical protein